MAYPQGVIKNFRVANLPSFCRLCYKAPYLDSTTSSNLDVCGGDYLFVGAIDSSNPSFFYMGAFGPRSCVLNISGSSTRAIGQCNDVFWYRVPQQAFGYSLLPNIQLAPGDISAEDGSFNDQSKLSWSLDNGQGGYRAGIQHSLSASSAFLKVLYGCQTPPPSPPQPPSIEPTHANSIVEDSAMCAICAGFTQMKAGLTGWTCLNGAPTTPICSWTGITCSNNLVSSLSLSLSHLTGTLSPSIGQLASLHNLDVSSNSLTGSLPVQLGQLQSLITISVFNNRFNGSVPSALCACSRLSFAYFCRSIDPPCQLCIPSCLHNLNLYLLTADGASSCPEAPAGDGWSSPLSGSIVLYLLIALPTVFVVFYVLHLCRRSYRSVYNQVATESPIAAASVMRVHPHAEAAAGGAPVFIHNVTVVAAKVPTNGQGLSVSLQAVPVID